jgi:hypothetical protein
LVTNYTVNQNTGLLISETLPSIAGYPRTTNYEYDVWGKRKKVIDYLGKSVIYTYNKSDLRKLAVTATSEDGSGTLEIYDDLGRNILSGKKKLKVFGYMPQLSMTCTIGK